MKLPNIPIETKPALWGIVGGAVITAIAGFTWGGWVTGGTADATSLTRANAAVVSALAPLCVEKFQRAGDVAANLAALKKTDTWSRADFIEKGGWATSAAGAPQPDPMPAVAKACALLLVPA